MAPTTGFQYLAFAATLFLKLALQVDATSPLTSLPTYRPFQNNALYTPPTTSIVARQLDDDTFGTCTSIGRQACGHACIDQFARCCDTMIGDFCDPGYYCTLSGCCLDDKYCGDDPAPICYDADDQICPSASGCCPEERPDCVLRDETYVCRANSVTEEEEEEVISAKGDSSNATATKSDPTTPENRNVITLVTTGPSATNDADGKAATSSGERESSRGFRLVVAASALAIVFSTL